MDICQIGYSICEFDSLRGLGIDIIGRVHFDNRDISLNGWAVLERRPNHVNKRVVADIWLLTVSWTLTWEMIRIRNLYCFVYRQHIWLRKWEVIVGGHYWSWDLWIYGGRGFVGGQRRSCYHYKLSRRFLGIENKFRATVELTLLRNLISITIYQNGHFR